MILVCKPLRHGDSSGLSFTTNNYYNAKEISKTNHYAPVYKIIFLTIKENKN